MLLPQGRYGVRGTETCYYHTGEVRGKRDGDLLLPHREVQDKRDGDLLLPHTGGVQGKRDGDVLLTQGGTG